MRIPNDIVKKIKDKATTFEVIQKFSDLNLKKEGVNYKACCPFHGEKTPSFVVSPAKDIFKCFGCGASGNGIDFIMQDQGLSYIDALKALAKHYNIDIPNNDNALELKVIKEKIIHEKKLTAEEQRILEEENRKKVEKQIYYLKKSEKKGAAQYLCENRGLDMAIIKDSFFYQTNKYKSETTGIKFPPAVAFLDSTETFINKRFIREVPKGVAKSRNTGNMTNKLYDKTYKSGLADVYMAEGVINAMSIFQCGKSVLATFATSNEFNDPHILAKYLKGKNVYMAFDPDQAGLIYMVKFAKFLYDNQDIIGVNHLYCQMIPKGTDANDLLKEGALKKVLRDRYNRVEFDKKTAEQEYQKYLEQKKLGNKNYIPNIKSRNLYNLEKAIPHIVTEGYSNITSNCSGILYKMPNTVGFHIESFDALYKLKSHTHNLTLIDKLPYLEDNLFSKEPLIYQVCKKLVVFGFNLKVIARQTYENDDYATNEIGFIQFYTDELAKSIPIGDTIARTEAVKKAAEFLATLDSSSYTVEYTSVYKKFFLNKADWNSIAKEYLTKEKRKQIYSDVDDEDGVNIAEITDLNNLPSYVNPNDFYRKGYFAAQNKEGKEVLYMFRSKEDGLFMASNFAMTMIGHLYSQDSPKNKRIVKITDEYGNDFFIEIESSTIRSFNEFSNRIYEESNLFFFGSKKQYEILLKHVSNNIPKWIELEILGQSENDFYGFADGIYNYRDKKFQPIDELGTVSYNKTTYYIPAFSSIYNKLNGNSSQFSAAKFLRYHKTRRGVDFDHTSFYKWTHLMKQVYAEDNAGMFAVVFSIMAAFRDFIFEQHRRFPLFFLSGPTNSGKSQVADSIQAPFAHGMQIYNLNSGTDAAFFVSLEKFRNVPMIFDEYNDMQISKIKFQGLKAGYDGVGKQKKKDVHSKELDMSEVNCAIVYLGQEIPEQDDYALFNRSLSFFIPLKDYSPEDTVIYDDLKKREEKGLTNILIDILNQRDILEKHYYKTQIEVKDQLKKELQENNSRFVERILNSVSEYLATFKIMLKHSCLSFAFDYGEFYQAAKEKCIKLSEMVQNANRLATFFQTITYLFNTGKLERGREFKIENRRAFKIRKSANETEELVLDKDRKVIFLRINLIFPMYRDIQKNESLKTSLLNTYIKDSPAYIGNAINEDFEWLERKILERKNKATGETFKTEDYVSSKIRNTTAIALDYDMLELELEKVVNDSEDNIETHDLASDPVSEDTNEDELPF